MAQREREVDSHAAEWTVRTGRAGHRVSGEGRRHYAARRRRQRADSELDYKSSSVTLTCSSASLTESRSRWPTTCWTRESENNGNLNRLNQDDINGSLNYSFPSFPDQPAEEGCALVAHCAVVQDRHLPRSAECVGLRGLRIPGGASWAGLDTDVMQTLSAGLQFAYSLSEARHINRKFSQMIITASVQLSLFAGDYR